MIFSDATISSAITGFFSLIAGWVLARGNRLTQRQDKKIAPYEALADRVTKAELRADAQAQKLENERERYEKLEDRFNDLEHDFEDLEREMKVDRAWIKRTIPALEQHVPALLWLIRPWPDWYDDTTTTTKAPTW